MLQGIRRWHARSTTLQYLTRIAGEYGPAWIVSSYIVGTATLILFYILLIVLDVHPSRVSDYLNLSPRLRWWVDEYGVLAAAYILNKLAFPVRLVLEIVLVRRIHRPVNVVLGPWWDWFWRKLGFAVGDPDSAVGNSDELVTERNNNVGYEMVQAAEDDERALLESKDVDPSPDIAAPIEPCNGVARVSEYVQLPVNEDDGSDTETGTLVEGLHPALP
ncbi:hypothetical protein HDU83_008396 [Entophlyctis luteolus]|nr:hypothetical protein HDU82_000142 [Entophlyctis luteolus]KAJ3352002.1 hypothetical protein HDU83_008396 [Entophlyctis luteolus]KAJ3381399.1 hypothetical protein HDU84_005145 [Entophlyctis sp. JEL0112]